MVKLTASHADFRDGNAPLASCPRCDYFKIECPKGSGKLMNLFEVSKQISDLLARIFLRDDHGRRPGYGGSEKLQERS